MPKVWIVQDKKYDWSQAAKYGDLEFVETDRISNVFNTSGMAYELKTRLKAFHPNDYLVLVGNAQLNALVFAIIMQNFDSVNLLIFSGSNGAYEPRLVAKHHLDMGRK